MRVRALGGLRVEDPGSGRTPEPRPRPLALLAVLAAAGAGGMSRGRVLGVLWPEVDEERASHALSQALYKLRGDLGEEVVLTGPTLRLDSQRMTSDVADFRAAVASKQWATAAALYAGPFLDGFHLADAPEFERWVESERASLATAGIRALEIMAKASRDEGRLELAAEYWHRLTQIDPVDPRIATSYMETLAAMGDRAAAVAHGRAFAELIRREFETEPGPEVERLMAQLREGQVASRGPPAASPAPAAAVEPSLAELAAPEVEIPSAQPIAPSAPAAPPARGLGGVAVGAAVLVSAAIVTALVWRSAASRDDSPPILAVGRIRDLVAPDSTVQGSVLSEMLATSLGRLADVQVVAHSRMLELTPRDADTSRSAFTDAARHAGADEVLEGEMIPLPGREYRLEVRRVELAHGLVRGGYRVAGPDRVALVDSVTVLIAADLRVGAPAGSLADVSTRSPVAYQYYEEGLRALYQYDAYAANPLFRAALREDAAFPMATYYAWRVAQAVGDSDEVHLSERALALAARAPQRDRLLIVTHVGGARADLRALAAAETLATRYPGDPEALVRAAEVTADLGRAVALLNRSIALDSAAGPGAAGFCRLCDALGALTARYQWADSVAAVERTLQRWRALRPNDAAPWSVEADWLVGLGRREEAKTARQRYESLGGIRGIPRRRELIEFLRLNDLAPVDRECGVGLASTDVTDFAWYRWYCAIALRAEGRYREARALVREGRVPGSGAVRRAPPFEPYVTAAIDMEMGRALEASDQFRAIARLEAANARRPEGLRVRFTTWALTLAATAAVAGGDTLGARALVDSIERTGHRSLFRRDPVLHHFVRGLLHTAAGDDEAAVRAFRASMDSPSNGYTRINLELGRRLLALRRPAEGIPVVRAALHGGIEGSGLYVTRTELHELLAQLFDASGQRDSAAVHYAVVERAWRGADPFLAPRYEAARQWLARSRAGVG